MNPELAEQLAALGLDATRPPEDPATWNRLLDVVDAMYDAARPRVSGQHEDASVEMRAVYEALLAAAKSNVARERNRYAYLFRRAPIAIFEEDYSAVAAWLTHLRSQGVEDLAAYLAADPDRVTRAASMIKVTDANPAAVRLVGAKRREDLLGSLHDATMTEHARRSVVQQLLAIWEGRPDLETELIGSTIGGRRIDCVLHWAAPGDLSTADYSRVVVVVADITDRKEVEHRKDEMIRAKDEFLATVSHELRTPLTAVFGTTSVLLEQWDSLGEVDRLQLIELIAHGAQELSDLIEDLLVVARSDTGGIETLVVAPEPIDLHRQVGMVLETLGGEEGRRSVDVSRVHGTAMADPLRFRQIVRNLVTNALRYGGTRVWLETDVHPTSVTLKVVDDGAGVPLDEAEAIFEPYHRSYRRPGLTESVGVGLTVSRRLAERMGGSLRYDGENRHPAFELTLPALPGELASRSPSPLSTAR